MNEYVGVYSVFGVMLKGLADIMLIALAIIFIAIVYVFYRFSKSIVTGMRKQPADAANKTEPTDVINKTEPVDTANKAKSGIVMLFQLSLLMLIVSFMTLFMIPFIQLFIDNQASQIILSDILSNISIAAFAIAFFIIPIIILLLFLFRLIKGLVVTIMKKTATTETAEIKDTAPAPAEVSKGDTLS
jgi:hypothetical protein